MRARFAVLTALLAGTVSARAPAPAPVVVASKPFGESYLLAEMFAQLLESRGIASGLGPGLAPTGIFSAAFGTTPIAVYPKYTATGPSAILPTPSPPRTAFSPVSGPSWS